MRNHDRQKLLHRLQRLGASRNELLADMVALAEREMIDYDVPPAAAALIANALADRLADFWGGQTISFPRDYAWRLAQKELEIYDLFTGGNLDDVIRASGMTERGVRKLVSRLRKKLARQQADGQGDMFSAA